MNTNRLLRLADLLETNAANPKGVKFDLWEWGHTAGLRENGKAPLSCETTACAVGLAVASGIFKDEGLGSSFYSFKPEFDGLRGFAAIEAFFEITRTEAEFLFSPNPYEAFGFPSTTELGERLVVWRIRHLCNGKPIPTIVAQYLENARG